MADKERTREFPDFKEFYDVEGKEENSLILHNDDVNTFEFVIESLIDICKHTTEQAEQCAYLVHYKGKCDVKKGSFTFLRPMRHALEERGLKATID
jgi:ATP-dependent Clp protease adaptor protein ClpS